MFAELFAHLNCALAYDSNQVGDLAAIKREDKYGPRETLASIGLYSGWYTVAFRPSKLEYVTHFDV